MENPFKNILHNKEVPLVLKEKVLNDIAMIKLSIDLADLFVVKYPNTIGDLLFNSDEKKVGKKKKKE